MQEKIKVVIADDNIEFAQIVKNFLNKKEDIEVVDIAKDGEEAVKMLAEKVESANKRSHLNQKLDEQAEKEAIYEALEQTGTVDVEMFYIKWQNTKNPIQWEIDVI